MERVLEAGRQRLEARSRKTTVNFEAGFTEFILVSDF